MQRRQCPGSGSRAAEVLQAPRAARELKAAERRDGGRGAGLALPVEVELGEDGVVPGDGGLGRVGVGLGVGGGPS